MRGGIAFALLQLRQEARMRRTLRISAVCALLALTAVSTFAQSRPMTGTVIDVDEGRGRLQVEYDDDQYAHDHRDRRGLHGLLRLRRRDRRQAGDLHRLVRPLERPPRRPHRRSAARSAARASARPTASRSSDAMSPRARWASARRASRRASPRRPTTARPARPSRTARQQHRRDDPADQRRRRTARDPDRRSGA